ncbi:MAG: phosphoribosylamine--glycine ligase [Selenomonadaceae bacterium]|nr:phosphoribosylamine--glycine ligase [Selenomonadaceae bacterium]
MNVLLIGGGGREHALARKISQSPKLEKFFAIPGSPGIADFAECVAKISIDDNAALVEFAKTNAIDLVVIGPEAPLVNGLTDALNEIGIKAFGPNKDAALLEGSKIFAKRLMKKYNIPTAEFEVFDDPDAAKNYIHSKGAPIVIKADGLAAGKGVIVAQTLDEALNAVDEMKTFGSAGNKIVVEEFMDGEEASVLALTDGEKILPLIAAQDHKRVFDGDKGLNTGGMGAYAPAPIVDEKISAQVEEKILKPTIAALRAEGIIYRGCLYAGLMIQNGEAKVVEFNCRFGDPETQVVLPLMESDLLELMNDCAAGDLSDKKISWSKNSAVCVILASGGYPKAYKKNLPIDGMIKAESLGAIIFHAGTKLIRNEELGIRNESDAKTIPNSSFQIPNCLVTSGGRVLGVTTIAPTLREAVDKVYRCVEVIHFDDMHYRKDIAARALK